MDKSTIMESLISNISKIIILILRKFLLVFWYFHYPLLFKNRKWKNLHKGETCFIFGNGTSLRFFDIEKLEKLPSIGCTYILADNRVKNYGLNYCVVAEPYYFFPVRRNSFSDKFEKNLIGKIIKSLIRKNKKTHFFCSLTNYYALMHFLGNISYFFHFGSKRKSNNLSGVFSQCKGSLDAMLGLAEYMGFKKVILIGCDYLGDPIINGHFYADSPYKIISPDYDYVERIKDIKGKLEVLVVLPDGIKCKDFSSLSFSEFLNSKMINLNNKQIVNQKYLKMMRIAAKKKQIWM